MLTQKKFKEYYFDYLIESDEENKLKEFEASIKLQFNIDPQLKRYFEVQTIKEGGGMLVMRVFGDMPHIKKKRESSLRQNRSFLYKRVLMKAKIKLTISELFPCALEVV